MADTSSPPAVTGTGERYQYPAGEVTVEIADKKNSIVLFGPTNQKLRGRWSRSNLIGATMSAALNAMPDLPGMHVTVNPRAGKARVFDPLSLPKYAETLRTAQDVMLQMPGSPRNGPEKSVDYSLKDWEIKSWLHVLRKLVDSGYAVEVGSTKVPTLDAIEAMPGRLRQNWFNTGQEAPLFRDSVHDIAVSKKPGKDD